MLFRDFGKDYVAKILTIMQLFTGVMAFELPRRSKLLFQKLIEF